MATAPHRSDWNRDDVGWATGPGERVTDTLGMFELYRRRPHSLCSGLCRVATRPDRSTPRKTTSPTRNRQSPKRSTRPSGVHECRVATSTGTSTLCRASGPSPLRLSLCGIWLFFGALLDLRTVTFLPPLHLRARLLRITPPGPSLVAHSYPDPLSAFTFLFFGLTFYASRVTVSILPSIIVLSPIATSHTLGRSRTCDIRFGAVTHKRKDSSCASLSLVF